MKRFSKVTSAYNVSFTFDDCIDELKSDHVQNVLFHTLKQYTEADRLAYLEGVLDAAAYSNVE